MKIQESLSSCAVQSDIIIFFIIIILTSNTGLLNVSNILDAVHKQGGTVLQWFALSQRGRGYY